MVITPTNWSRNTGFWQIHVYFIGETENRKEALKVYYLFQYQTASQADTKPIRMFIKMVSLYLFIYFYFFLFFFTSDSHFFH